MRKVVIGRGRECHVILADTTDVVSRRQAVIMFTFWGKMTLYDTSSNGTFVNGERLAKQQGKVVTRKDTVNFGHVWDLDWTMVKDPYRNVKVAWACAVAALLLVVGAIALFPTPHKGDAPEQKILPADTLTTDSTKQSDEVAAPVLSTSPSRKGGSKKEKSSAPRNKAKGKRANYGEAVDSAMEFEESPKTNAAPLIY